MKWFRRKEEMDDGEFEKPFEEMSSDERFNKVFENFKESLGEKGFEELLNKKKLEEMSEEEDEEILKELKEKLKNIKFATDDESQARWHELYEKWSWVASQFFDEAVKDFNDEGRAAFCLPQKIEEHLRRLWRGNLAEGFNLHREFKLIRTGVYPLMRIEQEFMFALETEISNFLNGPFSPEQLLKDSDKKGELEKDWYDFFYWGNDKRFAQSLTKSMPKVLGREEVKKNLDDLLWENWEREEVEHLYLKITKHFGNTLLWLRDDLFSQKFVIDYAFNGLDFYGYYGETKIRFLLNWWLDVVKEFMKDKKPWILSISPTADRDLQDILRDLYGINLEIYLLKKSLAALGYGVSEDDGGVRSSLNKITNEKSVIVQGKRNQLLLERYFEREKEIIKELRRQGKDYHFFWMRRFPWFWGKSYSEELRKMLSDYFEKKIREEEEIFSEMSKQASDEDLKAESTKEKEVAPYKKAVVRFERKWNKVQEMIRYDLGGKSYYWEKVAKVLTPILVLLTFLWTVGGCGNG